MLQAAQVLVSARSQWLTIDGIRGDRINDSPPTVTEEHDRVRVSVVECHPVLAKEGHDSDGVIAEVSSHS